MLEPEANSVRVLVVDESTEMRRKLRAFIQEFVHLNLIGMAEDAAAAISLFLHYRPKLVLVSICLPDQNGFEVLDRLKRAEPNCLIILMTKQANPYVEQSGLLLGASAVCPKSGNLVEMRQAIVRLLQPASPRPAPSGFNLR
jgi:DNA-binding NarL/FixJ family response regulator